MMQRSTLAALLLASLISTPLYAENAEVLHWWTSAGEASAVRGLKQQLKQSDLQWQDFAVIGGAGENAMAVLKMRSQAGNLPMAAAVGGLKIQAWGEMLGDISPLAAEQGWSKILPPVVNQMIQYRGRYVAAPLGIARVNTLWINKRLFDLAGAKVPVSWDDFFATANLLKKAGITPLAVGQQGWQIGTLFESVALGTGGADFYRKAFLELDPATLNGPAMQLTLNRLKQLKAYTSDSNATNWSQATQEVISSQAAMIMMGDWAKSEFNLAGLTAGTDYLCVPSPGSNQAFSFAADMLVMFRQTTPERQKAQQTFARLLMSKPYQISFNLSKGNFPARSDVDLEKFDRCARDSAKNFALATQKNLLVPSWAHNMAQYDSTRSAFFDIIFSYWKNDSMNSVQAAERLVLAAKKTTKSGQNNYVPLNSK